MESLSKDVNLISDFICWKFLSEGEDISVLKLQKLLYYTQAWNLALFTKSIFEDDFEAWVHGPCCPKIFQRFKYDHNLTMYELISQKDLKFNPNEFEVLVPKALDQHIDNVLEIYGKYSGSELEDITHQEDPWLKAREGLSAYVSSNNVITKEHMKSYYQERLAS